MSAWQPIETAPKNGSLLLFTNRERACLGRWAFVASRDRLDDIDGLATFSREYGWRFVGNKTHTIDTFTHWMPVPAPPRTDGVQA